MRLERLGLLDEPIIKHDEPLPRRRIVDLRLEVEIAKPGGIHDI